MDRTDFDVVFAGPGAYVDDDLRTIEVHIERLPPIDLVGIAIGDPLTGSMGPVTSPNGVAIAREGAIVELAIARLDNDDERVAAARVRVGEGVASSWIEADQGVGVDAGTAAIGPVAVIEALEIEAHGDAVLKAIQSSDRYYSAARVELGATAVCAFSSGWGDGVYTAWWGVDATGRPVFLAIDFDVLTTPVYEEHHIARPKGRGRVHAPELAARGVTISVPWLASRTLEVDMGGLPQSQYATVRFRRPGARVYERVQHHFKLLRAFRIALADIPEDAEIFVRIANGHRAMEPAPSQRPPFR